MVADIGWAYVAICGDGYAGEGSAGQYSEAVTIIVMQEHTKHVIRNIEWGRP